jgi:hypothetical protein
MHHHGDIHVVPDGVEPMRSANAATVAITGADENMEIRSRHFYAFGNGKRSTMNPVEAVDIHIMGKPAGATDARYEHGLLGRQLFIATQPLHGR